MGTLNVSSFLSAQIDTDSKSTAARIRNQRREADTLADYMHMNHPHAELSNIPSRGCRST